jgi:hypothetical protein
MYIYYHLFEKEDAEYYNMPQSVIQEGTGDPMPWNRPSDCLWMVPGTVDPNDD